MATADSQSPLFKNRALRMLLIGAGLCCTALGVLGIFLPLLPTVPLLLLAAALFARSSERFHTWLIEHRRLGPMIRGHLDGKGIPLRAKVIAIGLVWTTIPLTAIFFISITWIRILLVTIGLGISIYLIRLPVYEGGETAREKAGLRKIRHGDAP